MNLITGVVPPERFSEVLGELQAHGVTGIVATNAQVHGWAGGRTLAHRGSEYVQRSIPLIRIEFAAEPHETDAMAALVVRLGGLPAGVASVWINTTTALGATTMEHASGKALVAS